MIFTLVLAMSGNNVARAQVTIGENLEPLDGSILELISTDSSAPRGLRLPLLDNAEVGIFTSRINLLPDDKKEKAIGMLIFNTTTKCTMVWNGTEFKSLCGDVGPAKITPKCGEIRIYPNDGVYPFTPQNYQQGQVIDGLTSFMELPVTVATRGTYYIMARTGNGYSYSQQGTILEVGDHVLNLPGSGTPIYGTGPVFSGPSTNPIDTDTHLDSIVSLMINDEEFIDSIPICLSTTTPAIPVGAATQAAVFTMECSTSFPVVNGVYIVGQPVGSTHNITVKVHVTLAGYYNISAKAAGVEFSRSGTWISANVDELITLYSSGTPTTDGVIPITIKGAKSNGTNGIDTVYCNTSFKVAYRTIKVLGFGTDNYNGVSTTHSMYKIMKSSLNFGTTGIVPTQSISIVDGGSSPSATQFANKIASNNPDIIIIGYNYHPKGDANTTLANFINNKKGFVLMMTENDPSDVSATLSAIMGTTVTVGVKSGTNGGGSVNPFITDNANPLINGPFGDVGGQYWGEDATTTLCVKSVLPSNLISLSSYLSSGEHTIVWKKGGTPEDNNFVYIGDGGFGAGNHIETSKTYFPCAINSSGVPIYKVYRDGTVYNSLFFANVIAYAIDWVHKYKL
ncbi:MAG: hypothetical protein LBS50_10800 [Prevotellaceae bacterium]|nr:hypothetical protein [Prevotellaceae bacterium]